jgi:hypothetical protein
MKIPIKSFPPGRPKAVSEAFKTLQGGNLDFQEEIV